MKTNNRQALLIRMMFSMLLCLALIATTGCEEERRRSKKPVQVDSDSGFVTDDVVLIDDASLEPDVPGAPDTIDEDARDTCARYIECASDAAPAEIPRLLQEYGEDSPCWGSDESAQLCARSCIAGIDTLRPDSTADACRCRANSECRSQQTPACDLSSGQCVECTQDDHCSGPLTACDTRINECVECRRDEHCGAALPACDTAYSECAQCSRDEHCSGSRPICHTQSFQCVECAESADCDDAVCVNGICYHGVECARHTDCETGICEDGSCLTSCEDTIFCIAFSGDTPGTCLLDDACCNIGRCDNIQPMRSCVLQHCTEFLDDSFFDNNLTACMQAYCEGAFVSCTNNDCAD